jgi:hypothetical protein
MTLFNYSSDSLENILGRTLVEKCMVYAIRHTHCHTKMETPGSASGKGMASPKSCATHPPIGQKQMFGPFQQEAAQLKWVFSFSVPGEPRAYVDFNGKTLRGKAWLR